MTIVDFITELFCCVDDKLSQHGKNHKHSQAKLYPSEVVTIAMLFALKGVGNRASYRWIANNFKSLFPKLPERYPSVPDCSAYSTGINISLTFLWRILRLSVELTRTVLN